MTKPFFRSLVLALGLLTATAALAEEGGALDAAHTNIHDVAAMQRGARTFFNYCAACHSLEYMRYSRIAQDLDLSEAQVMTNLDVTGGKFGDPVISAMPAADATQWFGKPPPDLSLEVAARGPDWVYTYLKSFYVDPTRPTGWNNTVFPNVSMPFPLWELQGVQTAVYAPAVPGHDPQVEKLQISQPGALTPEQYDRTIRDLTTFLQYVSEPAALQRERIGVWVLLYLAVFTFLAFLLKREYWKDVH